MRQQWKGFVSGILAMLLLTGTLGTAVATVGQRTVNVGYNDIKVTLNGKEVNLVDANGAVVEPFAIDGTTYLPVRAVANALGLEVDWDAATKTVMLNGQKSNTNAGATPNDAEGYGSINGKYFHISLTDVKWTNSIHTSLAEVTPQKDGTKLLCLTFCAENTTDELKNLGGLRAYADGETVLPTAIIGKIGDAIAFAGAAQGGTQMQTYSVFELPENCATFQLYYYEADGAENDQSIVLHLENI